LPPGRSILSLAHPTRDSTARAYAASKLCNLVTARSLEASDDLKKRHITVIAYDPGLTGGTSLGGHSALGGFITPAVRPVLRFLSLFLSQLYMSTPEQSGDALAQLVLGQVTPPPGRVCMHLMSEARSRFPIRRSLRRATMRAISSGVKAQPLSLFRFD
jgi:NAD(P)-dependent dehydrogenase (short-subunit alcohol dehydrogenase family)